MIKNDEIKKQGAADLAFPLNETRFSGQLLKLLLGKERGDGNIQFRD